MDYIALGSLIVAFSSLAYTFWSNRENERRFVELNRPQITYTKAEMMAWEEFEKHVGMEREWGYPPLIFPYSRDYLRTDRFRRYTELILWDPKGNKRIFGNAPGSNWGTFVQKQLLDRLSKEAERPGIVHHVIGRGGLEGTKIFRRPRIARTCWPG